MDTDKLRAEIISQFLTKPTPSTLINPEIESGFQDDIYTSIQHHFANRTWIEIDLHSWAMIGIPIDLVRDYMTPDAFAYYIPSLLVGSLSDDRYVTNILEAILPPERMSQRSTVWWETLVEKFNNLQKRCILSYLDFAESIFKNRLFENPSSTLKRARLFWSS